MRHPASLIILATLLAASCADGGADGGPTATSSGDGGGLADADADGPQDTVPGDGPVDAADRATGDADAATVRDVSDARDAGGDDTGEPPGDAGDRVDGVHRDGDGGCIPTNGGIETCNGVDDDCDGEIDELTCDDGDPCTYDVCIPGAGCAIDPSVVICCTSDGDCWDGNSCTLESCVDGACSYELDLPGICCFSEADCDDGNACTDDPCVGSYCQHYAADAPGCCSITADCDDGNPCTVDLCDQHICLHVDDCCTSDAECTDADTTCTTDQCLDQTCVHAPTLAPGCCTESIYVGDFEDGTTEGHAIYNSVPGTGWQVIEDPFSAHSGTQVLYYGNPTTKNYDTGPTSNNGSASGPVLILPAAVDVRMELWLWMATEGTPSVDQLTIRLLLVENGTVSKLPVIWTKAKLQQYATWVPVQVDLSAFAGSMVRISIDFNTVDGTFNEFEGVYIDDISVTSTCQPRTCTPAGGCDDILTITEDTCAGGHCAWKLSPGYCEYDFQCNDGNDCTVDTCIGNVCDYSESDGCCQTDEECDDGLPCTLDQCYPSWPVNICSHLWKSGCCQNDGMGNAIGCDDLDPCTVDACPVEGEPCQHTPLPACCVVGADCDDGEPCTTDVCQAGSCIHLNQCCATDADCDDGDDLCTAEACVAGKCQVELVDLPGCCKAPLLTEGFDAPAGWQLVSVDDPVGGVAWHQSSAQAHSPPSAMWFGDPDTGTYDAGDQTVVGALQSGAIDVPVGAFTWMSLWFWLGNEFAYGSYPNPEWDRLRIEAQLLTSQQQPDGPPIVLWDSAGGAPSWWTTGPDGAPNGPTWTWLDRLDLTPFAGRSLRLRVVFDSLDGDSNGFPGAFVDDVSVMRTCGPL